MMANTGYTLQVIQLSGDPLIHAIPSLFEAMYAEMASQGRLLPLVPGGAEQWTRSICNGLERTGRLCVAVEEGDVIGFAHGTIKLSAEHQGSLRIGMVTHLYVRPARRRSGAARALANALEEWFDSRQVHSVELQVVSGNEAGISFWRAQGFSPELIQFRKW